jgi:hypothetical protein
LTKLLDNNDSCHSGSARPKLVLHKQDRNFMGTGKAWLGVLAGLAAGAALGVIFAPDKGSYTRKKITKKANDLVGALNHQIDERFDILIASLGEKPRRPSDPTRTAGTEPDFI